VIAGSPAASYDDLVVEAVREGLAQVMLLAAGMDARREL
jgi:O-methyltransferase involved in polyketide biosynthesis